MRWLGLLLGALVATSAWVTAAAPTSDDHRDLEEVVGAVTVDVEENGTATVGWTATYNRTIDGARFDIHSIPLDRDTAGFGSVGSPNLVGASTQGPGVHADVQISDESGNTAQLGSSATRVGETRFAFVFIAKAHNLSLAPPTIELDNATVVDRFQGGDEHVHALHVSDFDGGIGATAPGLHAGRDTTARLDVENRLVGFFECGEDEVSRCEVGFPNGTTREEPPAGLVSNGPPGEWSFHIDRSLDEEAGDPPYRLFAADIPLPPE